MKEEQIALVQDSFAKVVPIKEAAAEIFYARLFEIAPQVSPMFKETDLGEQGTKLMATLGVVVNGLKNLEAIVPVAQDLAKRHIGYGVEAQHYEPVGEALIYTLEKGLGDAFDVPTRDAWIAAYTILSTVMINAAYGTEEART